MTGAETGEFEIFLVAPPGLEPVLAAEAQDAGFSGVAVQPGGVRVTGGWPEVWRANLALRGATRVLARIGGFPVFHLAQLDKRARRFPWGDHLRPDVPVRVDATTRKSKIYHAGAARQRIETALRETLGCTISAQAEVTVKARIESNLCTFSIDTSGEALHKRGHKVAVGKAPMRETLASLFLRACGFDGTEPVVDPMCGSGTFVIEAAEMAMGLLPGRSRRFALESLASFDAGAFDAMKQTPPATETPFRGHGSDRDDGAIRNALQNAERAGVGGVTSFTRAAISDLQRPDGPPGLVIVNPPYGGRIGNRKLLFGLYGALGKTLAERFRGWRVGLITSDDALARATALPFEPPGPWVPHGGLKVRLFRTGPLGRAGARDGR